MATLMSNHCKSLPATPGERFREMNGDNEANRAHDGGGVDDIYCDSSRMMPGDDTTRLYDQLISIAEDMGEDDFELLKFLCRDHLSVSRLEAASSALDVFECMKKAVMIDEENVDFLLECLGRMHRLDLVKRLGVEPQLVKQRLANLKGIFPFRILLQDIAEDITDKEFETIKFFLSGRIKKKTLQERRSLLDLFVFMEQELLLSAEHTDLLHDILKAIKRSDLVDIVNTFTGQGIQRPPAQFAKDTDTRGAHPGLVGAQRNLTAPARGGPIPNASNHHEIRLGDGSSRIVPSGSVGVSRYTEPQGAGLSRSNEQQRLPGASAGLSRVTEPQRSPSAGTLSITSTGNSASSEESAAPIPEPIFQRICDDLTPVFVDVGIELGYTNCQLEQYSQQYEEGAPRTRQLLMDWMASLLDQGQVAPGLRFVLQKLGCKQSEDLLKRWMTDGSQGQSEQGQGSRFTAGDDEVNPEGGLPPNTSRFQPTGPPTENHYTSMQPAQLYEPRPPFTPGAGAVANIVPVGHVINNQPINGVETQLAQLQLMDEDHARQQTSIQQMAYQLLQNKLPKHTLSSPQLPDPEQLHTLSGQPFPAQVLLNQQPSNQMLPGQFADNPLPTRQLAGQILTGQPTPNQPLLQQQQSSSHVLPGPTLPGLQGDSQSLAAISPPVGRQQATVHPIVSQPDGANKPDGANTGNTTQAVIKQSLPAELPRYRMDRKPRGYCLIINNRDFYVDQDDQTSKEMPSRKGTDQDAELITSRFTALDFIVVRQDNLTDTQMMSELVTFAHSKDHSTYDCFACCILTHGVLNNVYGSNGCTISIKDLTRTFQANRCKSLAGKPKLFFIQACQGRDKMTGGEIEQDGPQPGTDVNQRPQQPQAAMIPNEADFLLGYATVPGYVSFRSRNHGTWYIRKLCQMLGTYADREDLVSILVKVNEEVSHANAHVDGGIYKQTPAPMVTLRKKLFFS